jgi:hypothetical protein
MGSFQIMHKAPVNLFDEPYQRLQEILDEWDPHPFLNF